MLHKRLDPWCGNLPLEDLAVSVRRHQGSPLRGMAWMDPGAVGCEHHPLIVLIGFAGRCGCLSVCITCVWCGVPP